MSNREIRVAQKWDARGPRRETGSSTGGGGEEFLVEGVDNGCCKTSCCYGEEVGHAGLGGGREGGSSGEINQLPRCGRVSVMRRCGVSGSRREVPLTGR